MKRSLTSFVFANGRMFLFLGIVALITALGILPYYMTTRAQIKTGKGLFVRTESHDPELPNYDIREAMNSSKDQETMDFLEMARTRVGKDAAAIADIRDGFVTGENALRMRIPTLKIEYSTDLKSPAVISPDVLRGTMERMTPPSSQPRAETLRNFIKENNSLVGISDRQADSLRIGADAMNPAGNMAHVRLEQEINGIPVYRGEIRAGFTRSGQMIRVLNDLAPGVDESAVSPDFGDPLEAVRKAYGYINKEANIEPRNDDTSTDLKVVFGRGDWATTAEKLYFPTEVGVVRPSWRVLIWLPVNAFYVIVDAETGRMLSRENLAADQTESATYNVYTNPNAYINAADSSNPFTPGPNDPTLPNIQGARITRNSVTRIGNEAPNPGMNNLGWITDGVNITDGNNVEAGVDRDTTNGVDAASRPVGSPNRTFNYPFNPGNPVDNTGDAPTPNTPTPCVAAPPAYTDFQRAAATQMFYVMNLYHDALYDLGFTEPFRNYQHDNFGRGGVAGDRVSAEGQDCSGTNNANFASGTDGTRGRMQMFIWTGPTPDFDGTIDGDVIIHEITHGTSNRLHNGLGNQGGMMGEGWSDWYAHVLLSEPSDPINGVYTTGGYATYLIAAGFTANYYYGIRRFPKAVRSFTGGPARAACGNAPCPHNPLSFRHLNTGCDAEIGTTTTANISAFPRGPIGTVGSCAQVHNAGEIWSSALWEVRSLMVTRLGHAAGSRRVLQVVTDGMKMAPANPMMLQERDAIIAAASALPAAPEAAADVADVREGFRIRGMGCTAQTISSTSVVEAFDTCSVASGGAAAVITGNNLLEPNECNQVNVPLRNNGSSTATNISAVLSTTTPGVTVTQPNSAYPDIPAGGGPTNNTTPYEVSTDNTVACFTQANFTLTVTFTGSGGGSPLIHNFSLPVGLSGTNYTFTPLAAPGTIPAGGTLVAGSQADDAAVAITLPAGWNSSIYGVAVTSLSASTNGMLTANGPASTTFTNTTLPTTTVGGANPTLFPSWDDYDMDPVDTTNGGIFINTVGAAPNREFYVEWRATHFADTAPAINTNFAVKLTEGTGTVQYIYNTTGIAPNADGASATVGIQRQAGAGNPFTQVSFNTAGGTMPNTNRVGTLPGGQCTPGNGPCGGGASADLSITKTDGVTQVTPGQNITYTIVATNNSATTPVANATVTDNFPTPALTNVSWTCTASAGSTCPAGPVNGNINAMVSLLPGGTATFTANATVSPTATFAFSNTATVATPAGTNDPVPGNNSARDTDVVCNSTPTRAVFTNNTPVPIPPTAPPNVVTSTIVVAGAGAFLYDVNVTTALQHTFSADLDVTLQSPAGTIVTLTTDNGGLNDNVFDGTVWDDDANPGGQVPYTSNNGMVTDHTYVNLTPATPLVPEEALGAFIGENPNGTWTITISDDANVDGGSLNSWSLDLGTFAAAPTITAVPTVTNNTPVAIPTTAPPNVVTSTVVVAGAGTSIYDVNLTTNLTHTFSGDLDVTLQSPAGTIVTLTTDNGGANDNVFNGTVWDDDANPGGQVPYTSNNGVVTDHTYVNLTPATPLVPEEAMAAFIGENPNGTWTITISDDADGDGGELTSWSLNIQTAAFSCNPTAAGATVSGRVLTPDGRGLRNAIVTITDSTGTARTARTSSFGYYSFDGIEVGSTYVISVGSKLYTFTPRTITVNDDVGGFDFIAEGSE